MSPDVRAIVLAGGFARRLWPLTLNRPKALLPLGDGLCIIDFVFSKLEETGVSEVVVATNRRFVEQFEKWASSRGYANVTFHVEDATREGEKPGALRGLAALTDHIERGDYLVLASDNIFSLDLREFTQFFREKQAAAVAVYDVKKIDVVKKYSAVKLDSSRRIVSFVEKPREPDTTLVGTAIYGFPWRCLLKVREYVESGGNADSPGHFISWLCEREPVYGFPFSGLWFDIGDAESYARAREAVGALLPRLMRKADKLGAC